MNKQEILKYIKDYDKTILKLKLQEMANEKTINFDERNARAEAISTARECENQELKNNILRFLYNSDIVGYDGKLLDECNIKELIHLCNII